VPFRLKSHRKKPCGHSETELIDFIVDFGMKNGLKIHFIANDLEIAKRGPNSTTISSRKISVVDLDDATGIFYSRAEYHFMKRIIDSLFITRS